MLSLVVICEMSPCRAEQIPVLWNMTLCRSVSCAEEGGRKPLRNVCRCFLVYMALNSRRLVGILIEITYNCHKIFKSL